MVNDQPSLVSAYGPRNYQDNIDTVFILSKALKVNRVSVKSPHNFAIINVPHAVVPNTQWEMRIDISSTQ